jgi:hypothetical protein
MMVAKKSKSVEMKFVAKPKASHMKRKHCSKFEVDTEIKADKIRMKSKNHSPPAIIDEAWLYKGHKKIGHWGKEDDGKGFCLYTIKEPHHASHSFIEAYKHHKDLWSGETYGKFCDKYIDFNLDGAVFGNEDHLLIKDHGHQHSEH